jgi:hypothetical protein
MQPFCELGEGSGNSGSAIEDVVTQLRDEDLRLGFTLKLLIHAVSVLPIYLCTNPLKSLTRSYIYT